MDFIRTSMIAFGPIPSRRLGQSLGINNIPPKSCSYNCVYCQVGPTKKTTLLRQNFYEPEEIYQAVKAKVDEAKCQGIPIDYLSFVPDGEPTLDLALGKTIELLRPLGIKICVITNGSLLYLKDVRKVLYGVDLVSLKVDAVFEKFWKKANRPNIKLSLSKTLERALFFAHRFRGRLITETMLVRNHNEDKEHIKAIARFLKKLNPETAYLAIPTRPTCESYAQAPEKLLLHEAYKIFKEELVSVKVLAGYPEEEYHVSGDPLQNILDITAVHPMLESEVQALLEKEGVDETVLQELLDHEELKKVVHEGQEFFVRWLGK